MKKIAFYGTLFMGLILVFIGGRFLLDPLGAETGFGISVPVNGNFSFHYIKGIRDLFTGIVILGVLWTGERRALGVVMLAGAMVPVVDFSLVLNYPAHLTASLIPHLVAIVLALLLGIYYLSSTAKKQPHAAL
ncbi:DUF4267 domain-containing protein [Chitinophaga arvensicola]|uniref:DUF4267 domain-containing protein n=1 Tax=Chitinophaga arvensicola TaxID=29529 RepID=A0A1I0QEH7_9BACT|nr:DUF4267 domain-containing protein [Chitinophaga arvensicola]SEW25007.1 protein of unknown function [Chitinophaga arvensicola]